MYDHALQVLLLNRTRLPPEAMFLIRHQKFRALTRAGKPYNELLTPADRELVPWLKRFRELSAYKRTLPQPPGGMLRGEAFHKYYSSLIKKYIPQSVLRW